MSLELEGCTTLLEVFDMPTSVSFYCDLLGFKLVAQSQAGERFDWGLLRRGHVELMLNTAYEDHERPQAPDPARVLAHRDTTLFFTCRDLEAAYAVVRAQGLDVKPPEITAYGMKQLWLKDPDGYGVCFQRRAT
jgi:catechol 2,3-dioxygenase-like lactoylglutathione lyase family enzyme